MRTLALCVFVADLVSDFAKARLCFLDYLRGRLADGGNVNRLDSGVPTSGLDDDAPGDGSDPCPHSIEVRAQAGDEGHDLMLMMER